MAVSQAISTWLGRCSESAPAPIACTTGLLSGPRRHVILNLNDGVSVRLEQLETYASAANLELYRDDYPQATVEDKE